MNEIKKNEVISATPRNFITLSFSQLVKVNVVTKINKLFEFYVQFQFDNNLTQLVKVKLGTK